MTGSNDDWMESPLMLAIVLRETDSVLLA